MNEMTSQVVNTSETELFINGYNFAVDCFLDAFRDISGFNQEHTDFISDEELIIGFGIFFMVKGKDIFAFVPARQMKMKWDGFLLEWNPLY